MIEISNLLRQLADKLDSDFDANKQYVADEMRRILEVLPYPVYVQEGLEKHTSVEKMIIELTAMAKEWELANVYDHCSCAISAMSDCGTDLLEYLNPQ